MFTIKEFGKNIRYYFLKKDGENFFRFRLHERFNSGNGEKETVVELTFSKNDGFVLDELQNRDDMIIVRLKKK